MKSGEATARTAARNSRHPTQDRLRADLEAYMTRRGLRSTEQRRVIIDTFFGSAEHITIDTLLREVRAVDARVGYATVYRTMKLLTESGVVQEHKFGDGFTRYELSDDDAHHDHLICMECGKITEFEGRRDRRASGQDRQASRLPGARAQARDVRRLLGLSGKAARWSALTLTPSHGEHAAIGHDDVARDVAFGDR